VQRLWWPWRSPEHSQTETIEVHALRIVDSEKDIAYPFCADSIERVRAGVVSPTFVLHCEHYTSPEISCLCLFILIFDCSWTRETSSRSPQKSVGNAKRPCNA